MNAGNIRADFIETTGGRVFVLARVPERIRRPALLIAPPFGEEMNKSRRMVTELSARLLQSGTPTVIVDLYGTGDSEGEFSDASWSRWADDLAASARWAAACGFPVGALLGIRLGCLLALEAAPRLGSQLGRIAFWQPVLSGHRFLDQFLRLGVVAALARGRTGASILDFRRQLDEGVQVEIAGYSITSRLSAAIDAAAMSVEALRVFSRVDWLEIVQGEPPSLPESSQKLIDSARTAGLPVFEQALCGMPFWTATETVVEPGLLARTAECFASERS